jgi:hypothetical protein
MTWIIPTQKKSGSCSHNRNSRFHFPTIEGSAPSQVLEASWNVMAHAQKPDLVFGRNGRIHLNRQGVSVQSTTGSRGVRISSSKAGYTTFRVSVKGTGYPLHSPVSPSLPLLCITMWHHFSTGVYFCHQKRLPAHSVGEVKWCTQVSLPDKSPISTVA